MRRAMFEGDNTKPNLFLIIAKPLEYKTLNLIGTNKNYRKGTNFHGVKFALMRPKSKLQKYFVVFFLDTIDFIFVVLNRTNEITKIKTTRESL